MNTTEKKSAASNELSTKWIYAIIIALVLGFGIYGYFSVKKWIRYDYIERHEKPITDYTITKLYSDEDLARKKVVHKGAVSDDDVDKQDINYYMEVSYKDKNYKLEIEDYVYDKCRKGSSDITMYYDAQGDEIFVAGTGGGNLFVTILAAAVILIIIIICLIHLLIKSIRKKR